ncbi:MAG: Sorbitol dehydrogenase [Actinomycetota bacterium]
MRALMLDGIRSFRSVDLPEPALPSGGVLIRPTAVALCGSDLMGYLGTHPRIRPPTVLGHEALGVVESIDDGVVGLEVGDRVAIDPTSGCGTCRLCRVGRSNICPEYRVMGEHVDHPGAMAGLLAVPAGQCHVLPDDLPDRLAAIVQPMAVSYHAAIHRARIEPGETVVVIGAGAIGLGVLAAARLAGAEVIIADVVPSRLERAERMGAVVTVDPRHDDLTAIVRDRTEGHGAEVVLETAGGADDRLLLQAVESCSPGGRVVVVGLKVPEGRIPVKDLKFHEKTVMGSQAHPNTFPEVIAHLAAGRIDVTDLVTHELPLDEVQRALELLADRDPSVLKVVLEH